MGLEMGLKMGHLAKPFGIESSAFEKETVTAATVPAAWNSEEEEEEEEEKGRDVGGRVLKLVVVEVVEIEQWWWAEIGAVCDGGH